ncbi:hypothetical protein ACF8E6_11250 [Pseudomonas sp. xss_1]|uniref:hypothetical protein n=1 Tax=Pseudomonas sp. xss_1 TaxID=3367214 RepID=UPI00370B4B6F
MPFLPLPSWEIIEEGRSYLKAAVLIVEHGDVGQWRPACVLAGFSMELFLKSFLAKDDSKPLDIAFPNGLQMYQGGVSASRGHELDKLFDKIPANYQKLILEASQELEPLLPLKQKLKEFAGYFFDGRYGYETNAIGVLRMDVLEVAGHLERVCIAVAPKSIPMSEL